eukprot:TRINITY_DN4296_c0_g1_i2.p1 TRINITY_DN4296_c0_g1~~TRINITY_DN4296_c0_g1_i2.p1  ORF type:complete len:613 (-),score=192.79 TRINITY_DN4296_c0_g1_i2:348-2186(-)
MQKRQSNVSELQQQLRHSQEEIKKTQEELQKVRDDLDKANRQLSDAEMSKAQALEKLDAAKKLEDETRLKLEESERKATQSIGKENDQNLILEQLNKERERLLSDIASSRKEHALDVDRLFSTSQQLEVLREQLAISENAKNMAASRIDTANLMIENLNQEIQNLKRSEPSLNEMHSLIESLRSELKEAKVSESKAVNLAQEANLHSEELKMKIEAVKAEETKTIEAYKSSRAELDYTRTELQNAKLEITSLTDTVNTLRADLEKTKQELIDAKKREKEDMNFEQESGSLDIAPSQATAETREATILLEVAREAEQRARTELEQVKSALQAAERKYGEQLREARMEADQARDALQRFGADARGCVNTESLFLEKYAASLREYEEIANGLRGELEKSNTSVEELKAFLMDKETELQSIKEENENLRSKLLLGSEKIAELEKLLADAQNSRALGSEDSLVKMQDQLKEAYAKIEDANIRERETLEKLRLLKLEVEDSKEKATDTLEQLEAVKAAKMVMETEMKKNRIQTEQWKKAADAAATVLQAAAQNGEFNGKFVERSASMDKHILQDSDMYGLKYSSPRSEDLDHLEASPNRKRHAMLRKFGTLFKKKNSV